MAVNTPRRIQAELNEISLSPPCNCFASPKGNNLYEWAATIKGADGTPYEGGTFFLTVNFPATYPFKPPKITFRTRIYHCNINAKGEICLDTLKSNWSPILTVSKVLLSICALLTDPNPDDPLVPYIAKQLKCNKDLHDKTAAEWTKRYAVVLDDLAPPKPVEKKAKTIDLTDDGEEPIIVSSTPAPSGEIVDLSQDGEDTPTNASASIPTVIV
mmetsp:Transcript_4965/g.5386  ORF Transcript_4965/g.5386 Transcript_4965/m.5386 type:complete len:214 (-) Transcript_4965:175-816(-)